MSQSKIVFYELVGIEKAELIDMSKRFKPF